MRNLFKIVMRNTKPSQVSKSIRDIVAEELPDLVKEGEYSHKLELENKTMVFFIGNLSSNIIKSYLNNISFAGKFAYSFLKNHGIKLLSFPFKTYLCSTRDQVYQIACINGRRNVPPGVNGTIVKNQLVICYKAEEEFYEQVKDTAKVLGLSDTNITDLSRIERYQKDIFTHEATHTLVQLNKIYKGNVYYSKLPYWLVEGFAIYVGGKTRNLNYIEIARNFSGKIPPITLELMNKYGMKGFYEFGHIELQRLDLHPAFIACGSFFQFLVEEIGFKISLIWELIMEGKDITDVFKFFELKFNINLEEIESKWLKAIGRNSVRNRRSDNFQMEVIDFDDNGTLSNRLINFKFLNL